MFQVAVSALSNHVSDHMSFSQAAGNAAKPFIYVAITHPVETSFGTIAIAYGLRNPSTRGWTIRMCQAHGINLARFAYHGIKDTVLITWSETLGSAGVKRRAASSAAKKAAQKKALLRTTGKGVGKRALAKRGLTRAIPFVGWGILAYDVLDFAIGDDPSFIGDIIEIIS